MRIRTLHNLCYVVKKMIRQLENGESLPIVHCVDMGEYVKALEGTHRLLAYHIAGIEPEIEILNYDDVKDTPILDIIGVTDGDNDFLEDDTVADVLEDYETVGEDLEW